MLGGRESAHPRLLQANPQQPSEAEDISLWNLTAADPVPAPNLPARSRPQSPYELVGILTASLGSSCVIAPLHSWGR